MMVSTEARASVARGLAVIALVAACVVAARVLSGMLRFTSGGTQQACAVPIDVVSDSGVLLGCGSEPGLAACTEGIAAGDKVELRGGECIVEQGGMRAAARLLSDLPLDVNRATAADLELLDGVGAKISTAIVAERERGGPFQTIDDLERVSGIGRATVDRLRPTLVAGAP